MLQDTILPVIISTSGYELNPEEKSFLKDHNVFGIVIMGRNISNKTQLKKYISSIIDCYPDNINSKPTFFIDLECGGVDVAKVKQYILDYDSDDVKTLDLLTVYKRSFQGINRLAMIDYYELENNLKVIEFISKEDALKLTDKPKYSFYTAKKIGDIFSNGDLESSEIVRNEFVKMADALNDLGIDGVFAPCADLIHSDIDNMLTQKERLFSTDPEIVSTISQMAIDVFKERGINPVIKHMPGHGMTPIDSHFNLPRVEGTWNEDTKIFTKITGCEYAMVPHIVYDSISSEVSTVSHDLISYLRNDVLNVKYITDAIEMKALEEYYRDNSNNETNNDYFYDITQNSLKAGMDYILCCTGDIEHNRSICQAAEDFLLNY